MKKIDIFHFITPDPRWPYHPLSKRTELYKAIFKTNNELLRTTAAILSAGRWNVTHGIYALHMSPGDGFVRTYYTDHLPENLEALLNDYLIAKIIQHA